MDVRLPDGTIIRGVPEGTTKADLVTKLKANGYDTSGLEGASSAPQMPEMGSVSKLEESAPQAPGPLDRMLQAAKTGIASGALGVGPQLLTAEGRQNLGNAAAGALAGAGTIGSTLIEASSPMMLKRAYDNGDLQFGDKVSNQTLSGLITGKAPEKKTFLGDVRARNEAVESGLQSMGADPESTYFAAGKLGGQIAGTAGMGGVLGGGAKIMGASPALVNALKTGGMSAGGQAGAKALAARVAGGAATGGASAALVDPESAGTGALIGGALPIAGKVFGEAGKKIGTVFRGPQVSDDVLNAAKQAYEAGYVIPPTQVKPTLGNRLLEGLSGKITTAQNASAKNTEVTNKLAAKALGLSDDVKITPDVLEDIRKNAGAAYREVASLPIKPAQEANSLMNIPSTPEINPSKMVFDLRKARNDATAWYNSYGRTADPESLAKAQASKNLATELEGALEGYAKSLGRDDLVSDMAKSRELIAKTYSVEKALNTTTGNVDSRNLAKQLDKGKPLTGELKQAAEFAARFPKAAQTVEGMGSLPQTSPLDWAAFGGIGAATANPFMLLGVGARPIARAAVLSGPVQRGLQNAPSQVPPQLIKALRRGALAAPVMATSQ